jgi:hypothetical protein
MFPSMNQFPQPPNVAQLLPSVADWFSPTYLGQLAQAISAGGRLASTYDDVLYDTARFDAAALPVGEFEFFSVPRGQNTLPINGTVAYQKSLIDTNMTAASQLPQGNEFWACNMQASLVIIGQLDNSVQTTNPNVGLPLDPGIGTSLVAADDILAVNLAQAFLESLTITFVLNNVEFESGPLIFWPSRYGISGFSGTAAFIPGTAGTTIMQNETAVNNGFGAPRDWSTVRHIPPLYSFSVRCRIHNPFTVTRPLRLRIGLEGLRAKSVTA